MKDKRTLIIITARIGSSRLPNKILKPFWKDRSILEFLIGRLKRNRATSRIKLAIPDTPENDIVAEAGIRNSVAVCRGPEDDVLERMHLCMKNEDADHISRVTADNPFTDPDLFNLQFDEMIRVGADYSYCKDCPKGLASDIWTRRCFEESILNASTVYEHEHANAWIWNNEGQYNVLWFRSSELYKGSRLNFSIDTLVEYEKVKEIAASFEDPAATTLADLIS